MSKKCSFLNKLTIICLLCALNDKNKNLKNPQQQNYDIKQQGSYSKYFLQW